MANACIVLLCGLPGAGKSFLAKKLFEKLSVENGQDDKAAEMHSVKICYDSIVPDNLYREDSENHFASQSWKEQRRQILCFVDQFLATHEIERNENETALESIGTLNAVAEKIGKQDICACFSKFKNDVGCCTKNTRHTIIVDDNMFYSSMRYEYYQIARKYSTGFLQVYISCKMEDILRRNASRSGKVSRHTILKMNTNFEIPDKDKNEWEKNTIYVDTTSGDIDDNLAKVLEMVDYCFENPAVSLPTENLKEKEETRQINLKNILHQSDNALRKFVSLQIKEMKETQLNTTDFNTLATELSTKKKKFLESLKNSPDLLKQLDIHWTYELETTTDKPTYEENATVCRNAYDMSSNEHSCFATRVEKVSTNESRAREHFEHAVKTLFISYKDGEGGSFLDQS